MVVHLLAPVDTRRQERRLHLWLAIAAGALLCVILVVSSQRDSSAPSTALVGDDFPMADMMGEEDPLSDMMINGGPEIAPVPTPPTRSNSIPPTGIFTGHGHSVGGGPLTIGDNTYFVRALSPFWIIFCVVSALS